MPSTTTAAPPPIARLRYRHSRVVHALRVAVGILVCLAISAGLAIPYGYWIAISYLVVTAGLQHHGNIRRKAIERALGTLLGAACGIAILGQQWLFGFLPLTWLLLALASAICAYHAVGRGGYTALLTAITLMIIAGHGSEPIAEGLWRGVNVLIGIGVALGLSFIAPLYATWFWRETLASALRECATLLRGMGGDAGVEARKHGALTDTLQQLRALMPSVASETGVSAEALEAIQGSVRLILSGVEYSLAAGSIPADRDAILSLLDQMAGQLAEGTGDVFQGALPAECGLATPDVPGEQILLGLQRLRRGLAAAPSLWGV